MTRLLTFIVFTFIVISCQRKKQYTLDDFFEQTFNIIQEKSIKRNEVEWDVLKKEVTDSIKQFNSNEDVYRAIGYTVKLINDGHSIFVDATTPNSLTNDTISIPEVEAKIIDESIGYIKLSGFVANTDKSRKYSAKIREALYTLDSASVISGWIVDLRKNVGGSQTMMPLGLAPLFQDSLIGIYVNNKGEYQLHYCTSKYFYLGNRIIDSLEFESPLSTANKKIAILTSNKTASSGEYLASAFKFQPSSKIFGSETKGKTTTLELINFKSDAKLLLATLYMCNKNKEVITTSIYPDVECNPEDALDLAVEWIKERNN